MKKKKLTVDNQQNYNPETNETISQEGGFLSMLYVRTHQCCKKCGGKFTDTGRDMICLKCLTRPNKYRLEWRYKNDKFQKSGFNSYVDAVNEGTKIEREIKEHRFNLEDYIGGSTKIKPKFQFNKIAENWLEERRQDVSLTDENGLSPSYFVKNEQYVKEFIDYFKDTDIRTIKTFEIRQFEKHLKTTGISTNTRKKKMDLLRKMFKDLKRWYGKDIVPGMPEFDQIKIADPETKAIEEVEQMRILEHIPVEHKPIFQFMFKTGFRPAEVRALKWSDIYRNAKTPYIHIRASFSENKYRKITKTKNQWVIPILPEISEILKNIPRSLSSEFVFTWVDGKTTKPYMEQKTRRIWREACKKAGIDNVTCYEGTRHSFITQKLEEGVEESAVSAWVGHKCRETIKKYDHAKKLKLLEVAMGKNR
jgi:integrase